MTNNKRQDMADKQHNKNTKRLQRDKELGFVRFAGSLPFHPQTRQVIYTEDSFRKDVNDFLNAHYDAIGKSLREAGFEFCYLPRLADELRASEFVSYFTPYQDRAAGTSPASSSLMPYLAKGAAMPHASLLVYNEIESHYSDYAFSSFNIRSLELQPLLGSLLPFLDEMKRQEHTILACSTDLIKDTDGDTPDEDYADDHFSEETQKLMDDVREKIRRLRQIGVGEMVLRQLLMPEVRLSRLRIDERGRILLPDYGDREIKMTPLVKAVYLLFLRHPEGIKFKCLPSFRAELLFIYNRLTGRSSGEDIRKSIDDVTNPCKNSINEKCARIREAFLREFDDSLASHYYITGNRAEAKRIDLPEELKENLFLPPLSVSFR